MIDQKPQHTVFDNEPSGTEENVVFSKVHLYSKSTKNPKDEQNELEVYKKKILQKLEGSVTDANCTLEGQEFDYSGLETVDKPEVGLKIAFKVF